MLAAFSPKVRYVYEKQLEEAEIIVINKQDLVAGDQLARLKAAIAERYPRATDIEQLPTYVAVDEDHRILGQLAAPAPNREIAVKYFAGG